MDASLQMMGDVALSQSVISPFRAAPRNMAQIDKAAKEFEGMFMSQMLQPMFQGLDTSGSFGGGHAEEIMRSLLIQEYGKVASRQGGIGIADAVKREMIRAQEMAQNPVSQTASLSSGVVAPELLIGGNNDAIQ